MTLLTNHRLIPLLLPSLSQTLSYSRSGGPPAPVIPLSVSWCVSDICLQATRFIVSFSVFIVQCIHRLACPSFGVSVVPESARSFVRAFTHYATDTRSRTRSTQSRQHTIHRYKTPQLSYLISRNSCRPSQHTKFTSPKVS